MENENQTVEVTQAEALKVYQQEQRRKRKRWIVGSGIGLVLILLGYFGYQNQDLFRAAITETGVPAGAQSLYIPNYEASVADEGLISVKTRQVIPERIHSVAFTLRYNPVNALVFNNDSVVFDEDTLFQSAELSNVNTGTPGQVAISLFSNAGLLGIVAERDLFKLQVRINPDLPAGTEITLTAEDVEVVVADPEALFASSDRMTGIDTGTITLATQADLRLLYAEALDNTHVLLHFSDLLATPGEEGIYTIRGPGGVVVPINTIQRGDAAGFSQDTVRLTTGPLNSGGSYVVEADEDNPAGLIGNTQGGLDREYRRAPFFAPGPAGAALSDFGLLSARATGPTAVDLTFSHAVNPASITEDDFDLIEPLSPVVPRDPEIHVTDVVMEGSVAHLTLDQPLLAWNTYLIAMVDPQGEQAPRRAADGARLGVNIAVLRGTANGPQVTGAEWVDEDEDPLTPPLLEITFDNPVTPGPGGGLGSIRFTGALNAPDPALDEIRFDPLNPDPNITLEDNILRIAGFLSAADQNYTFIGNSEMSANGVPLDSSHNSITFWGDGHDDTQNTIGAVAITRANRIEVQPGTLNFSVNPAHVRVVAYETPLDLFGDNLGEIAVDRVNLNRRALRIETNENLTPTLHYLLIFLDPENPDVILRTAEVVLSNDLNVVSAETIEANQVRVTFSENIDQGTVEARDFTFVPALTPQDANDQEVTAFQVGANFRTVTLTLIAPTRPGQVYRVTVGDVRSFSGAKPLGLNTAVFAGHQTEAELSVVRVNQVEPLSRTRVRVTFSGPVNPASVTAVNVAFLNLVENNELAVTTVTRVDAQTFEFTTSAQTADRHYFFAPVDYPDLRGVTDPEGLILLSTRILHFFGFQVPPSTVGGFTPGSIVNDEEQTIVIAGQNLNTIQAVRIGNTPAVIVDQPANGLSLTFRVPANFAPGTYDITLINQAGQSQVFPNALVVTEPERPMRVISEASLATPFRVPNDGRTETTLRVLVEDPLDLDNIDSVSIDLTLIGGDPSVEMQKARGAQPANRQWYVLPDVTVPVTIRTSQEPYELPVEVRKGAETATGFASVHVTSDQVQSVPPAINPAFFTPPSVPPDATTRVKISAQVSDTDGADTITSVVANLGPLGVGFVPLREVQGVGAAAETTSRFYESAEFTIPRTTPLGSYQVTLTAQDESGETGTVNLPFNVSSAVTGPTISAENSYIAPRSSVPRDGVTTFSLHVFVNDLDGMGDIASVIANFGALGLPPKALTKAAEATDAARSGYFTAEGLTIPVTTSTGVRQIVVTVTDEAGSTANHVLQIDVTDEDTLGEPPLILADRAYTTPRVAVNDGRTPFTLHVFVRDNDDDIESVLVNLAQVGQLGPVRPADFEEREGGDREQPPAAPREALPAGRQAGDSVCPTNSSTLVCFEPSVREGREGQWFILPEVTITPGLTPQAYTVEVIATDISGKTSRQEIPIQVSSSAQVASDIAPPTLVGAVATNAGALEVVFSEPLNPNTLSASGSEFTIISQSDVSDALPILGSTINADGNIVTLTTEAQTAGKAYVLSASNEIQDAVGVPMTSGPASRVSFTGFAVSDKPPVVEYIAATSLNTIEIEFRDPLKPTSFGVDDISIKTSGVAGANELRVLGVKFLEGSQVIEIKTEPQKPGERYRVTIKTIQSAAGIPPATPINKLIKGFKAVASAGEQAGVLRTSADLNGDNKVDFIDFTMFSAVYGTTLESLAAPATPPANANQPIPPRPDATVPVTAPVSN